MHSMTSISLWVRVGTRSQRTTPCRIGVVDASMYSAQRRPLLIALRRRFLVAHAARKACSRLWNTPVFHMRIAESEEHTSELQSLMRISYAVFCLKKKTN